MKNKRILLASVFLAAGGLGIGLWLFSRSSSPKVAGPAPEGPKVTATGIGAPRGNAAHLLKTGKAPEVRETPQEDIRKVLAGREARDKAKTKIDGDLHLLVAVAQREKKQKITAIVSDAELATVSTSKLDSILRDPQGRIGVRIRAENPKRLAADLKKFDVARTVVVEKHHLIETFVPLANVLKLDTLTSRGLLSVSPIWAPIMSAGTVTSQGVTAHSVDRVQSFRATNNGAGFKIGVISDSFNYTNGANADAISGDLPQSGGVHAVTVVNGDGFASGGFVPRDEGRAMLQIIHDLAPGSQLYFSTALGGEATFAQNIRDLAAAGCKVIVDDVIYHAEPMFQDGLVAQAVNDVVTNNGVAYFGAAGNQADRAYEKTSLTAVSDILLPGTYIVWNAGDTRKEITMQPGQKISIAFQWDDPFYTASGVDTDIDLVLVVKNTASVVASAFNNNIVSQTPFEGLEYTNNTGGQQVIELLARVTTGPTPGRIKYVHFGDMVTEEYLTNSGTVQGACTSANAMAVGAIGYYDQGRKQAFSAKGGVTILFDSNGNPITPENRAKPDIAAVDSVNTTFFGAADVEGDGFLNFSGTSAAAPHAAAMAALIWNENPAYTPAQLYQALRNSADPSVGDPAFVGAGLVNAWKAVYAATEPLMVPKPVNYSTSFEEGYLNVEWATRSTGAGRIKVTSGNGPQTGGFHVTMDSAVEYNGNETALNTLTLAANPSGLGNVTLRFNQREFNDSDDPMTGPTFTDQDLSDGVAFSVNNGVTWFRLVSLTGGNSTAVNQQHEYNISQIAATNGVFDLGSQLLIRFQQYGRKSINLGGMAFDDITVSGVPATPGVSLLQTGGDTTVTESGVTDTYQVFLNTIPSDPVTVTITPDSQIDLGLGDGVPIQLTFPASSAARTPQTVTVRARDDVLDEGNHSGTITHVVTSDDSAYNSIAVPTIIASIADNDKPALGLTVTNTNNGGLGSLRQALLDASNPNERYTITFTPSLTGTITLGSALPVLSKNLELIGPGADKLTISGANLYRVLEVAGTGTVRIQDLTIANGQAPIGGGLAMTGAANVFLTRVTVRDNTAQNGGGLVNNAGGNLTLLDCTVKDNTAQAAGGILNVNSNTVVRNSFVEENHATQFSGGGLQTINGTLEVLNSTLNQNNADDDGGAIFSNNTIVTVTHSFFQGNHASSGGAIHQVTGDVNISTSTFNVNDAGGGGGVNVRLGTMTIETSLFADNRASGIGGGFRNENGTPILRNVTFEGNQALLGGGIYNQGGALRLSHATVTNNKATNGAGGLMGGGDFYLQSTIVYGNTLTIGVGPDLAGVFKEARYNLIGSSSGYSFDTEATGNLIGSNPLLQSLGDNGGPTETMALGAGSPAINVGLPNAEGPTTTDQRGAIRVFGGRADIGAYEVLSAGATTVDTNADVVNNDYSAGNVSLREAIAATAFDGEVKFSASYFATPRTIVLNNTLHFDKGAKLIGPGVNQLTISGNNAFRVLDVPGATVELKNLTVANGAATGDGGAVEIRDQGTLILTGAVVRNSTATGNGGAIMVNTGSTLTAMGSVVRNNAANSDGGGIFNDGGEVHLTLTTVSDNTTAAMGGGIASGLSASRFTLVNSLVSANTAATAAGGILHSQGRMRLLGSTISGNITTAGNGGGVLNTGAGFADLYNTTIIGNHADAGGGGGYYEGGGTSTFRNSLIGGNTAGTARKDLDAGTGTFIGNGTNFVAVEAGALGFNFSGTDKSLSSLGLSTLSQVVNPTLANNGGLTQTHELVVQGSLVDAGNNAYLVEELTTDQRGTGFPRVVNNTIDLGAMESEQPEIAILTNATLDPETGHFNGTLIADGTGSYNLGKTAIGYPLTVTLTVDNTYGTRKLNIGAAAAAVVPTGFSITGWPNVGQPNEGEVPAGGWSQIILQLNASATGTPTGTFSFSTNDSDENPYNFTVSGDVGLAEINIKNPNNVSLPSGTGPASTYDFGTTDAGVPIQRTFKIENVEGSGGALNLFNMTLPTGWFLVGQLPSQILPGQSADLTLQFHALAAGSFSGTVQIQHNDDVAGSDGVVDENPYEFVLTGVVTPVAAYEVTSGDGSGFGTLRAALDGIAAGGTITFNSSLNGATIKPGTELVLNKNVTLDASALSKLILDGNNAHRVFRVNPGVDAVLDGLIIRNGNAAQGAGLWNNGGNLTFRHGAIEKSTAAGAGGGLYSDGGSVKLFNISVTENKSTSGNGGGVAVAGGTLTTVNTTISSNQAVTGSGGGVHAAAGTTVEIYHSTVVLNSGATAGGLQAVAGANVTLGYTILGGNSSGSGAQDLVGPLTSSGYNILGTAAVPGTPGTDENFASLGGVTISDLIDPVLRPNGPRGRTHALARGSTAEPNPALNVDANFTATVLPTYSTEIQEILEKDQDGAGRVISGAIDVGAKEFFGAEGQVPPPWGQGALNANVSSNFNDDVDEETLDNTTFVVRGSYRGKYATGLYSATGPTATFDPAQDFFPGELVTASLYPGITSGGGGSGSVFHWQFRAETTTAGTGVFKRDPDFATVASATVWGAFADINRDGKLDFVAIRGGGNHSIYYRDAKSNHLNSDSQAFGNGTDLGGPGAKSAALGDFNNDGRLDILVVHGSNIGSVVYLQSPDGVFNAFDAENPESDFQTAFTGGESRSVAVADLDGDGDLDAVIANYNQPNQVAMNDGHGNFTITQTFTRPFNLCVDVKLADVDGDGDFDAIVARDSNFSKQVYLNDGGGVFTFYSEFGNGLTSQIGVADVSGDTFPDVVVANRNGQSQVFINNGSGQFGSAVQTFPAADSTGVVLGDLNGDGWVDVAFSNTGGVKNEIWLKNTATGQFEQQQQFSVADYSDTLFGDPNASGIVAGDIDLDGDLDLVTLTTSGLSFNTLWLNTEPIPPTATVTAASNLNVAGGSEHVIEIRYDDNVRVDYSNLNNFGVRVVGPNGYNRNIDLIDLSTDWDAPSIIVRYRVRPTGDVWNYQDNGTYQVYVQQGQVPDTSINHVIFTGNPVGSFEVNIPDKLISEVLNNGATGDGSLAESLAQTDPDGTIRFDLAKFNVPRTVVLDAEQVVSKNLNIIGPGASLLTIKAAPGVRAFNVTAGAILKIQGATVEGGDGGGLGGGAIRNAGTVKLIQAYVKGGTTTTDGGGIYNLAGGVVDIVSSALSDGFAAQRGGGVFNAAGGTVRVINSTLAKNKTNGDGGAIYNLGTLTVLQSTLAYNEADADANFSGQGGGLVNGSGGTASLKNSYITDNYDKTPINEPISGNGDPQGGILRHNNVSGAFTDGGFNFIQDASGSTSFTNNLNGNKVGFYPFKLYSLVTEFKLWGGETPSIIPVFGAAVVDAGPASFNLAAQVPAEYASLMAYDQRGEFWQCGRIRLGKTSGTARIDIGAIELDPYTVVSSLDDTGTVQGGISLREAIRNAHTYGGVVTFAPHHPDTNNRPVPLVGTYRMDMHQGIVNGNIKGVIPITKNIQVIGPGRDKVTVTSFEHAQNINAPYIRIAGPGTGPLIRVHIEGLRFELDGDDQAAFGIESSGADLVVRDCEFVGSANPESNNPVGVRGVYVKTDGFDENRGSGRILNCHFHDLNLGGFFDTAPVSVRRATLRVQGCKFENNDNLGSGGAIAASDAPIYLDESEFIGNKAQAGGAIGHYRSDFDLLNRPANPLVLNDCEFRDNEAGNGAAIDCFQTTIHALDTLFQHNVATGRGGGINISGQIARLETYRTQFHGNRASNGGGIAMNSGAMKIVGTEIVDSIVSSDGGGVYATNCEVELFNSAFSRNAIGRDGGGVFLSNSKATLAHATVSLNTAGRNGGGVYQAGTPNLQLISSAVVRNEATGSGGGVYAATCSSTGTAIADNKGANNPEISGTLSSGGYNLIGDTTGLTITGVTTGNLLNQVYPVGPLRNNGGPAVSHDPLFGNAGTNTGDPAFDGAALLPPLTFAPIFTPEGMYTPRGISPVREVILLKDTRTYARTVNGRTDIGPVEYFGVQTPLPQPISGVSAVNGTISATFNDQLDPATLDSGSVTVWGKYRGFYNLTPPSGAAFNLIGNIQFTLDPVKNYFAGEDVTVFVEPGVAFNPGGNPSSPYQWTFRAATSNAGGGSYRAVPEVPSFGGANYTSVALGDVDNDGDIDVVAATAGSQPNAVFLNDGTGNFTAAGTFAGGNTTQILLADMNSDGFLDAVAANHSGQAEEVFLGNGTGAFTKTSEFGGADTNSIALGDVDGDGDIDAIIANNGAVALYANNGAGVLTEHEFNNFGSGHNRWIVLGDVDGDGDLDAVVTRASGQEREVYANDGNGHFISHQTFGPGNSTAAALGDIDGDGDLDAVFANTDGAPEEIFLNDGNGNFSAPVLNGTFGGGDSTSIVLGDVDGDGDLDAIVANTDSTKTTVYRNDGIGQFTEHPTSSDFVVADTRSLGLGDIDGDGDLDLIAANFGAPITAWLNVEATPPTAALTNAPTLTTPGVDRYQFTVTYSDNVAIDVSSLGANDIRVTGPNGFDRAAALVGINLNTDGTPRVATYEVTGPAGGAWNFTDNGTYTVALQANAVADNSINYAGGGNLGTFLINLPPSAITVNNVNNSGTGSLRQAILDVAAGGDIYFAPSVFNTGTPASIVLTSGELLVNKSLKIHGPGADKLTIDAAGQSRIFNVTSGVTAVIQGVTLAEGSVTGNGGAILNAGTLDLIYVWVKDSEATAQGGGLASSGTVRIISSVFSGNAAGDNGGGVITQGGAMTVVNSTFTENEAVNHGGALYGTGGTLVVRFSTISDNLADSNAGGLGDGGAIRWESSGTATVEHSILAGNTDLSPAFWVSTHPDISGTFTSGGYNLIGIRDGATGFTNGVNNDQVGTVATPINPLLGALTNHGGPLPTMALNLVSPAVNRGNPLFDPLLQPAPFDSYLIYDNRGPGFARVVNERLDLGAFELEEPEIVVKRADTSSIPNGTGTYNFGTVEAGANGTAVFTVSNTGTGELQLTEPIQLPSGVSLVSTFGTTTLAAGQSTTFTVHLDTAAPHAISGTIQFGNNDADEGTFAFGLTGQVVDTTAPSASLTPLANITTTGVSQLIIDVTFNDIVGVNIGSIGTTDISVSGPVTGFPASPTAVTILDENGQPVATNGPARKARFTFNVPTASGKFGWRDNGTYTINLVNGSVADTTGNSVTGGALGSFQVNVPRPFALWQQRYFNNGAGGLLPNSGAEDDADQDGLPNAYEYLFGSNPNDAQSTPNFDGWFFYQDTFDNYDLKFSFAYPLYKDDMSVEFQVSDDLITWRTAVANTDYQVEQDAVFNGFDAEYFPNQHVTVQKRDVRYQIITSRGDGQRQAHFRLKLRLELP